MCLEWKFFVLEDHFTIVHLQKCEQLESYCYVENTLGFVFFGYHTLFSLSRGIMSRKCTSSVMTIHVSMLRGCQQAHFPDIAASTAMPADPKFTSARRLLSLSLRRSLLKVDVTSFYQAGRRFWNLVCRRIIWCTKSLHLMQFNYQSLM